MHNNNFRWWFFLAALPVAGALMAGIGWKLPAAAVFVTGIILCFAQIMFSAVSIVLALAKEDFSRARLPAYTLVAALLLMLLHSLLIWWGLQ